MHKLVKKCKIVNGMCDTVLRPTNYDGKTLNSFLRDALRPSPIRHIPKLTVYTLQRLAGHIDPRWLDDEVAERFDIAQCSEPGKQPIDHLVAPAVRTLDDFAGVGAVVTRIASSEKRIWRLFEVLPDIETGMLVIEVDDLHTVGIDPRAPTIWREDEYNMIADRLHPGSGRDDRIGTVAKASVALSGFSASPMVPEIYVTATLRHFV